LGTISFNNQTSFLLKNKLLLKAFLPLIFIEEGYEFKSISYIFCSDEYLLELNQKYLKHNTYTDILTFTLSGTSMPIVSEIYISVDRVKENAQEMNLIFSDELHRVMIHGILHLCGYSDHTSQLKEKIHKKEDYYLNKLRST
jgi:rRNA maturation RNase YbeY